MRANRSRTHARPTRFDFELGNGRGEEEVEVGEVYIGEKRGGSRGSKVQEKAAAVVRTGRGEVEFFFVE